MSLAGWIAVDLDGTLAHYESGQGVESIGPPIVPMVERVKEWLVDGMDVRIFTARVAAQGRTNEQGVVDSQAFADTQRAMIEAWCREHLGRSLPVTATKDFLMEVLYDDRCVQVEKNTGRLLAHRA